MFTIDQVQKILNISYPTALGLAQRYGIRADNGKWLIPDSLVTTRIAEKKHEVQKMEERLRLELTINILN